MIVMVKCDFYPRDAMLARSLRQRRVCPSLCPSVRHAPVLCLPCPWNPDQGSLKVIESDTMWPFDSLHNYVLLLASYSNFVPKMHRFRDMTTYWSKIAEKTHPTSFGTFLWGDPLWIFRRLIPCQKLESWGYHVHFTILLSLCYAQYRRVTDRQTDGRTDGQTRRCRKEADSVVRNRFVQLDI